MFAVSAAYKIESTSKQGTIVAKEKIFHVLRKSDSSEHLVRAVNDAGALLTLAGDAWRPGIATQDDITEHYAGGGTLHPASVAAESKGAKIVRLLPAEGSNQSPVLIRAKNIGAAIEALTNGDIEVKVADQETLVRLLEARTKVLEAPKSEPTPQLDPTTALGADSLAVAGGQDGAPGADNGATIDSQGLSEQVTEAA